MEVTLKEASVLCRKSEKTLRRKIDCGLLEGRREPLEFGGFMWLINVDSLDELYPGSRPSQLPQLWNSPELPQVRLKNRAEEEASGERQLAPTAPRGEVERRPDYLDDDDDDDEDEEWNARQSFLDYILDENRGLKLELKDKEARILGLNERAFVLERALGEQEGKAATQARVLEWFQSQESEREKQRAETERKLLEAGAQPVAAVAPRSSLVPVLAGVGSTLLLILLLLASGVLGVQM